MGNEDNSNCVYSWFHNEENSRCVYQHGCTMKPDWAPVVVRCPSSVCEMRLVRQRTGVIVTIRTRTAANIDPLIEDSGRRQPTLLIGGALVSILATVTYVSLDIVKVSKP